MLTKIKQGCRGCLSKMYG